MANRLGGFDPSRYEILSTAEQRHFWFASRNRLVVGLLNKFFPDAQTALEFGCGNGFVTKAIATSRTWRTIVGADLFKECEPNFRNRVPQASFRQIDDPADLPSLGTFDVIGAFDVLEHIKADEDAIASIRSSLTPGGGTMISVPQHPRLWSREDEVGKHVRRYRLGELERKLRRLGFDVVFSSSYMCLLLPLMIATRVASSFRTGDGSFERDAPIPPLNSLLKGIADAEISATLAGFRWPVGGSRFVVARCAPSTPTGPQ